MTDKKPTLMPENKTGIQSKPGIGFLPKRGAGFRKEYAALFRLGIPVAVTQLGVIVVSFADTMMVGAYGINELAAAAFVNNLFMVVMLMQIGFAAGVTPLVGALFSQKRDHDIGHTLRVGLQLNTLLSLSLIAVMGTLYFFLDRFGQPEELMPLIRPYYLIVLATLLPAAIFNCCMQTSNGVTDTATPMWLILGANVLNICGNWLLIFGNLGVPELGLTGAGVSTLTARICAMSGILLIMARGRRYRAYREGLRDTSPSGPLRRKVWTTSYPVMIQNGVECFLWSLAAVVCGWFGKIPLASFQVVNTIAQLGFMIYISIGVAASIRVANHNGVRDVSGMRLSAIAALHINLLLATCSSLLFMFGGETLIGFFTDDPGVVACALTLIFPLVLYQYGDAVQITYGNAQRGTSEVKPLLTAACVAYIVVGAPLLLLAGVGFGYGVVGVYYSFSGALVTASILLWRAFRRTTDRKEREFGS